jgi:hypothetical protein
MVYTMSEAQIGKKLIEENQLLRKEIKFLSEENYALAAWQCPYRDGRGLTNDEYGNQFCMMVRQLEKYVDLTD